MNINGLWKYDELVKQSKNEKMLLLNKINRLEEEIKKLKAENKKLKSDTTPRWAWDEKRREWLPANGTISYIATHVPFPVMTIEKQGD